MLFSQHLNYPLGRMEISYCFMNRHRPCRSSYNNESYSGTNEKHTEVSSCISGQGDEAALALHSYSTGYLPRGM